MQDNQHNEETKRRNGKLNVSVSAQPSTRQHLTARDFIWRVQQLRCLSPASCVRCLPSQGVIGNRLQILLLNTCRLYRIMAECALTTDVAHLTKCCQQWRLKPSASRTMTSAFHLLNTSSRCHLLGPGRRFRGVPGSGSSNNLGWGQQQLSPNIFDHMLIQVSLPGARQSLFTHHRSAAKNVGCFQRNLIIIIII